MKLRKSTATFYDLHKEDADLVEYLPFNRAYKVRTYLVNSMKKWGFIGCVIAFEANIYGTKKIFIADGQHRIASAHSIDIPAVLKVEKVTINNVEDAVEFVAALNTAQKNWTNYSYVKAYSSLLIPAYMKLWELSHTSGFTVGALSSCLIGARNSKQNASKTIRNGTFAAKYYDETLETISFINSELGHFKIDGKLLVAINYIRITKKFEKTTFIQKFTCNYKKIVLMKPDEYVDYFLSW